MLLNNQEELRPRGELLAKSTMMPISHFQVVLNLCFKARLSVTPLTWKWYFWSHANKIYFQKKGFALVSFWKWEFLELRKGQWQLTTVSIQNNIDVHIFFACLCFHYTIVEVSFTITPTHSVNNRSTVKFIRADTFSVSLGVNIACLRIFAFYTGARFWKNMPAYLLRLRERCDESS